MDIERRIRIRATISTLIIAVSLCLFTSGCSALRINNDQAADYVFSNGRVYTVNKAQPWAEAVAVKANKIVYVGDTKGVKAFVGEDTELINLAGKMLLPGFFSAHEHLIASGWMGLGVKLGGGKSKDDYLKLVKEYADANPDEKFIRGLGWNVTLMGNPPTAADLDAIVPDRPVMLQDYTVHDMWMNSKAMEMGGVNKDTNDPVPGLIEWVRDKDGNPTGYAKEFAWMEAFIDAGAWQAEKMMAESQKTLYEKAARFGYTGYINQGLVTPNIKDIDKHYEDQKIALKLLDDLHKKGQLKLRTFLQVLFKNDASSVDDLITYAKALKNEYDSDVIRVSGIKVHPEGVHTSHASIMLEPWTDQPDKVAKRGVSVERTDEVVMAANKVGFDVSVHVDGSKTVRDTIDSYLKSQKEGHANARNTLQHYAVAHPDDTQRVIENKIPVNLTPIWATTWGGGLDGTMAIIGKERALTYFQQIRTLVDGGTNVSIAADVPNTDSDLMGALVQCEAAITRRDPSNPEDTRVFPPMSQALTLEQCLYAATMGGAYEARMETKVGSIEVGKYADLVILEKNLFDVASDKIADVTVEATMMDGKFTYQKGEETGRNDQINENVLLASAELIRNFMCGHPTAEHHGHAH